MIPKALLFDMAFRGAGGEWIMAREDPDFYQHFVAIISADGKRIDPHPDASDDEGKTWRKDLFDRKLYDSPGDLLCHILLAG